MGKRRRSSSSSSSRSSSTDISLSPASTPSIDRSTSTSESSWSSEISSSDSSSSPTSSSSEISSTDSSSPRSSSNTDPEHVCCSHYAVLEGKYQRRKKSVRKLKRKLKFLKRRLGKRVQRRDRSVQDFLGEIDSTFSAVTNEKNKILWRQLDHSLQKLIRDVLDEVAFRWSRKLHLPKLNLSTVKVRDGKAIIPRPRKHRHLVNYAKRFAEFVISLCGLAGQNTVMKDFIEKLSDPKLSLLDFQNLYFHKFLQSREDITAFPVGALDKLWELRRVDYRRFYGFWTEAYRTWVENNHKKKIELGKTCRKNKWAERAWNFRFYIDDDPVEELNFVRNFIVHFSDCRSKDVPCPVDEYDSTQIGQVVYDLFPHIVSNLYTFMYECRIYMDFTHVRTYYSEDGDD